MAAKMDVPVLGIEIRITAITDARIVEGYEDIRREVLDEEAEAIGVPVLAKLPINPELAKAADGEGRYFGFEECGCDTDC